MWIATLARYNETNEQLSSTLLAAHLFDLEFLSSDVCDCCSKLVAPGLQAFVDQVMELVELNPLRDSIVGLPGVTGLSTEQRKRLTIAVELVANPSIIFMDEPTSGLDARAAAIVMRTVRNTVDTGRTVVCTIHQPSIDIFEAFDEVLVRRTGCVKRFSPADVSWLELFWVRAL